MLIDLLKDDAVPFETLHARYGSLLALVRTLIGVVPNCDPYLEIWPPAFRAYNVMVPNLLNLPLTIWGLGAPRATIGLAMYAASRAASCAYCSAHACSFALRRGAAADDVAAAIDGEDRLSPGDRAAVRVGRALARVPTDLTGADRAELLRHFSAADAEWIVLSVVMMGWLNKLMDGLGVPLEVPTVAEVNGVIAASGWTPGQHLRPVDMPADAAPPEGDSFFTKVRVIRHAPSALSLDKQWTAGVPDRWPAVGDYLREKTGHDFPVLSRITHRRAIRAIATMIRDTLAESVVGRAPKLAAGLVYAETVGDEAMADELRILGAKPGDEGATTILARAISTSPARVDAAVVERCREIPPAGIVELTSWISVLQMLHRLSAYYPATAAHA